MRLRSRGLGRKELVMDFREYDIVRRGHEVVIMGTIRDPVTWEFSIRFCEDDLAGIARIALRRPMLALLLRSAFRRRRRHHWSDDPAEHVAKARARRDAAREKFLERERIGREAAGSRSAGEVRRHG